MTKRRKFKPAFNAQLVLETISGAKTQTDFAYEQTPQLRAAAQKLQVTCTRSH